MGFSHVVKRSAQAQSTMFDLDTWRRQIAEQLRGFARRAEGNLRDLAGLAGETVEEVVEEGKEFVDSKKAVLREAFDAGREAMRRERDRLREEDRS